MCYFYKAIHELKEKKRSFKIIQLVFTRRNWGMIEWHIPQLKWLKWLYLFMTVHMHTLFWVVPSTGADTPQADNNSSCRCLKGTLSSDIINKCLLWNKGLCQIFTCAHSNAVTHMHAGRHTCTHTKYTPKKTYLISFNCIFSTMLSGAEHEKLYLLSRLISHSSHLSHQWCHDTHKGLCFCTCEDTDIMQSLSENQTLILM